MVMTALRLRVVLGVLVLPLFATACSEPLIEEPSAGLVLHGAGATFPLPLYEKWVEVYEESHPEVAIEYLGVGSGEGTTQFLSESVDFGASDAALTDEQMSEVKRGAQLVPTCAGSIVLAYNLPGLTGDLKLSREVYVDIFLNKITMWNDARIVELNSNLELPKLEIALAARQDSSGTTFAFTNHLSSVSPEWHDGPGAGKLIDWPGATRLAHGNEGVAGLVKRNPGAIGYVEFGVASRADLQMASLENKAGNYILPTGDTGLKTLEEAKLPENFRAFFPDPEGQGSYPIVTYTWMLLYKSYPDETRRDALKQFVNWCLEDGQHYNQELGYIRLTPETASRVRDAVASIK